MRLGFRLFLIPLVALAVNLAFGSAAAPAKPTKTSAKEKAHVSLKVPGKADSGTPILSRGEVTGLHGAARVVLQVRQTRHWKPIAHGAAQQGRFRIRTPLPPRPGIARLRASVMRQGKRVAVSAVRRVRVRSHAKPGAAPAPSPTTPSVYWGAWIGPQLTGEAAPWDMNAVTSFEGMVGKPVSLLEFAAPFQDCSAFPCVPYTFPAKAFSAIRAHGAIPFLSWASQSIPGGNVDDPQFQLADIRGGAYDAYIREWATAARNWGHPFFLRFDWEMNGNWFPWAEGVNGNQPGEYVAAWRHVHDIFTSVGAKNVTWVWCPYLDNTGKLETLKALYPGDGYVDWTCLDGYNWGPEHGLGQRWSGFDKLFAPSYRQIVEGVAPSKPMVIGETASSEEGGSKSAWIDDMFESLPVSYPAVKGLVWYEYPDRGMAWPVESSAESLASFAAGIGDPRYAANSYGGLSASPIPPP